MGTDIHRYQIALLQALSEGWLPPENLSEDLYKEIKDNKDSYPDYLVGYAGFQLSFSNKWFGGYRRDKPRKRNYAAEAYRGVCKQAPLLKDIRFACCDFRGVDTKELNNYVIYCDIPYQNTTRYATEKFPYDEFYSWAKDLSSDNTVLISEYSMPPEFNCIWAKDTKVRLDYRGCMDETNNRTEKLFICDNKQYNEQV